MSTTCTNCGCQCVTPRDCGNCGCGSGASSCPLSTSPVPFCIHATEDLVSTRELPLFQPTTFDFGTGQNNLADAWPWVCDTNEGESSRRVIVNLPPRSPMWFDWNSEQCRFVGPEGWTLSYGSWTLTSPDGEIWQFTGFESGELKGRFNRYISPGRGSYQVYDPDEAGNPYTDGAHIKGLRFTYEKDGQTVYRFLDFSYSADVDGREHLASAVVRKMESPVVDIERALFSYRTLEVPLESGGSSSSSSSLSADDYETLYSIKSITRQIYEDDAWVTLGQTFTKHYGADDENGYPNAPKYEFDEEAYERLMADAEVTDADTASDTKLAEYATTYYEYDSQRRITQRRSASGSVVTYAYEDGDGTESERNQFATRVTETQNDCAVTTTYKTSTASPS